LLCALYLDGGLVTVETFATVVLFPRLHRKMEEKAWMDPKLRLLHLICGVGARRSRHLTPFYK